MYVIDTIQVTNQYVIYKASQNLKIRTHLNGHVYQLLKIQ